MHIINLIFIILVPFFSCFTKSVKEDQQVLHISFLNNLPKFIHPSISRDSETTTLAKALFEGLTRINLDGIVELGIAEKIELSKCKTKYTIYLRQSKWSNNETCKASHFINAWKAAILPNTRCLQPHHLFVIKNAEEIFQGKCSIDKLGVYSPRDDQIIIHLKHPVPYFLQLLADPIFSPLFDINEVNVSIFNGPFVIDNLLHGKEIHLKKNPLYWDASTVKLNRIEILQVTDENSAYKLYKKGKLDFIGSPFSDLTEEIILNEKKIKSSSSYASYWMYINTKNPKLSNKKIRKALSLAINRNYISKHILSNAIASSNIIPKGLSLIDHKEPLVSIKQIQKLFFDGLNEICYLPDNFAITLSYASSTRHANIAKYLKYQWEKIFKIKVILEKSDWNTFYSKLNLNNFEIGGFAFYTSYSDPLCFLNFFYDKKKNRSSWEDLRFKNFIDQANICILKKERDKFIKQAEEILENEAPVISIYNHKHLYLHKPNLKNLYPSKILYQDFKWAYFSEN
jgi:oligopeptide transport system substrate-binding protein